MKKFLLCFILILMGIPELYSQNLVLNGDFSAGNTDFVSDYVNAATNTNPATPLYGVVANPNLWDAAYPACTDHTGSSGNMMVLNGANLNNSIWKQTIAVAPSKNYTFSFWVHSLEVTNPASLSVLINGVAVGTAATAPASAVCGNWLKVSTNWSSAASISAIVEIRHNVGTTGSAFAIDDISFNALPTATITGSNSVCQNSVGNVIAFTGADGVPPYTFIYNVNGGTNQSISTTLGNSITLPVPTNTVGNFSYNLVSVSYGTAPVYAQNQTGSAIINVLPLPTATISGNAYVCSGATGVITFAGTPGATVNYIIDNTVNQSVTLDAAGNATVTSPALTANSTYELVTVDSNGPVNCTQTVIGSATLSVPTATIFGSATIAPGESAVITFFGTPGVTVNFTSSLGPNSVVLNSSGIAYYNIPYLDTTTTFSLVSATVGACVTNLSGSATITVNSICTIASAGILPLAEVEIIAPQAVCNLGQCTDLLAQYTKIATTNDGVGTTSDYEVCAIPYAPTFPFTGGTVINATGDDSWSPIVTLPFTFNFYGNCYNNVLVGTNGVITFDLVGQTPLGGCQWQYNQTIPNAGFPIKNAIYGVYQDTNIAAPPVVNTSLQNVNYYILDTGANAEPNRVFVANFNELPQFSCNNSVGLQTSQIVIHETTNIIEVLVSKRTPCNNWNPGGGVGNGVIGIQNLAGDDAKVPLNRNTGNWTANNEAWGFYPIGRPSPILTTLSWEEDGNPIPGSTNQNPITVCPVDNNPHTYTAIVEYVKCDGTKAVVEDDVTISVAAPLPVADPQNITFCSSSLPPYTVNINQNAAMLAPVPVADQGNYSITYYERYDDAKNAAPNNIDFNSVADLAIYQVPLVPKTIYVRIEDLVTTGCFNVRSFVIDVVSSPAGTFSYTAGTYCNNDPVSVTPTLYSLTSGGTFSASSTDLSINPTTGAINATASVVGTYTVTYFIPATALCPAFSTTATVQIIGCTCTVTASSSLETVCVGTAITPITYTAVPVAISGSVNAADLPPGVAGSFSGSTFTISGTPSASGTYTFPVTLFSGPTDSCVATTTIVVKSLPTATISTLSPTVCSGTTGTVTISGTAGATVTYNIGGAANQTTVLDATGNATLITAILTSPVTYNLVSISTGGTPNCSQSLTGSVTINVTALPTASISGGTTICSGSTTPITFTGTAGATVTYLINNTGTAQTILLDAAGSATLTTLALTATTTYDLVSASIGGSSGCSQTLTGSVTVTVKALPTASVSGTTTICSGSTTTITYTGTAGATVNYLINNTGAVQTIVLDALGTASLTPLSFTADTSYDLVSVETGGTPNCIQNLTGSALVTVKGIPSATISGSTTICSGFPTTITFTGTPDATVTYLINNTGTAQTILLDAAGNGSFTTLPLTSNTTYDPVSVETLGTPNCSQSLSGSVLITVSSLPTASISGATTICSGTTTAITFTGTPNAIVTYLINNTGTAETITLDGTGTAILTTSSLTADTSYDLVSAAIGGSSGCSQNVTGSVTVIVKALPTASISGATTICSGTTTLISITGTPGAIVTYTIGSGSNQTTTLDSTGNAVLVTAVLTADTTYNLVSVATGGTPNCIQTLTGSVLITVKALPTASISGGTTICSGTTTAITFTGTQDATVTYLINNTGTPQTILLDNTGVATLITSPLTSATTYDLVSAETGGIPNCSQSITGSVTVNVKALPTASISGTTTICSGATTVITFTGTPGATVTYLINNTGTAQTILLDAAGNASFTTLALTSNTSYDLVSVETGGIPNCIQTITGSALVAVNSLPTASISGDTICSGSTGSVSFTGTPGATVTYNIGGGTNFTTILDATGSSIVPTSVLITDATYNLVSVSVTGVANCSQLLTGSALVRVLPLPTAIISGSTQLCLNAPMPLITFTGSNGQSPYTFTYSINGSFPQTISTAPGSDTVTLSAPTTAAGIFSYDLISVSSDTTPSCSQGQLGSAVVTILRLPTASISGTTQVCINDAMPQITFTGVDGQPPYTFNYKVNNGPVQNAISGIGNSSTTVSVPTTSDGTFVYELVSVSSATTPSCSQNQSGTATVVVRPGSTLTTTSQTTQSVCVGEPITAIVLNIGGSATGVNAVGLPSGLSGSLNAAGTVYTITGSPSAVGSSNYTVTTTGGCNPAGVITGTITSNPNATIALVTGNSSQNICINTAISPIRYTIGTGATGATITAGQLPTGVTAIFSAGTLTISGTAVQAGNFVFTVTTTGGCSSASLIGNLSVRPEVDLVLLSAPITTLQSVCVNTPITPIRYNVLNGATGANVTGLPAGITYTYNNGLITISGSSSVVATHAYVITTVGGCGSDTANGSITINPNVTLALVSPAATTAQRLCINEAIDPIIYSVGSGATGASLIAGTVPDGIQGTFNQITKEFTISGIAIESGSFGYTISTSGGCGVATLTGTIVVSPLPVINLPQDGFICVDVAGNPTTQYTLSTNLQASVYSFEWSDVNGVISGATGSSYVASAPGLYTVKVTNISTGCFDMQSATIVPSLPPSQVFTTVSSFFDDNQMVQIDVTPVGNYLYQLDTGLFQDDPFFTNLPSGYHTVTVKDRFGCGSATANFRIVNFPRFFTPNDDGYNDTWNIFEIANDQPDAYIYIFDRYGKLLKEQSVVGPGWDGLLNGVELPSSDYWFRVFYRENGEQKEYKSHFSLKR